MHRLCLLLVAVSFAFPAFAQYSADKPLGASAQSTPSYLKNAGLDQRLGTQILLNLHFVDSTGKRCAAGQIFRAEAGGAGAGVLQVRHAVPAGAAWAGQPLAQTGYAPARDYDVIVASIDPDGHACRCGSGTAEVRGAAWRQCAAGQCALSDGSAAGDHGAGDSVGFHYVRVPGPDGKMTQFAHSSVIMVATPEGKLSKYLAGVEYPAARSAPGAAGGERSSYRLADRPDPALLLQLLTERGPLYGFRAARAWPCRHGVRLWAGGDALPAEPQAQGEDRGLVSWLRELSNSAAR